MTLPLGRESVLELRVLLVDSHPEIWRQLEVRASTSLGQVHEVLQVAFGWEDAHLHRFTDSDPFAPLRPIDGEIPEALQWLPKQWCAEPGDRAEEGFSLDQLLASGSGMAFYEYDLGDSWLHRIELIFPPPSDEDCSAGAARWKTPEVCPVSRRFWMLSPIRLILNTVNIRPGPPR